MRLYSLQQKKPQKRRTLSRLWPPLIIFVQSLRQTSYPRSSWKMQLGVRAPAACSWEGPVTVVSPPATTYGCMKTLLWYAKHARLMAWWCCWMRETGFMAFQSVCLIFSGENCVHKWSEEYSACVNGDYLTVSSGLTNKNIKCVHVCAFSTCSCTVPVAFLSRVTACEWLMPSAEVPQILTMRSPICKRERKTTSAVKSLEIDADQTLAFFPQLYLAPSIVAEKALRSTT